MNNRIPKLCKKFIILLLCSLLMTSCGKSTEEILHDKCYRIGSDVVVAVENFLNRRYDLETTNNRLVPLALDAERVDAQLYEYISEIIGDVCTYDKYEGDEEIQEDLNTLRDYIGYPDDEDSTEPLLY